MSIRIECTANLQEATQPEQSLAAVRICNQGHERSEAADQTGLNAPWTLPLRSLDTDLTESWPVDEPAMPWAQRRKRVFNIDIETCVKCGGAVRVIACIEDPVVIKKILTHLQ